MEQLQKEYADIAKYKIFQLAGKNFTLYRLHGFYIMYSARFRSSQQWHHEDTLNDIQNREDFYWKREISTNIGEIGIVRGRWILTCIYKQRLTPSLFFWPYVQDFFSK